VFNLEWPGIEFNPTDRIVDQVTAVSMTTSPTNDPLTFTEMLRNFPIEFTMNKQPNQSDFYLKVAYTLDGRRVAVGESFIEKEESFENLKGSYLQIIAESDEIEASSINVTLSDSNNFSLFRVMPWFTSKMLNSVGAT